jgi:hypothetical protein
VQIGDENVEIEMAGEVSASGLDGEMTMAMRAPGLTLEATSRVVLGTVYLRFDDIDIDDELGGDPGIVTGVWYEADDMQSAMGGVGDYDPNQYLAMLEDITGEIEELGSKKIDGGRADGYRVELSIDSLIEAAASLGGIDAGVTAEDMETAREELAGSTMTIDVWLRDDTVVQLTMDLEIISTMQLDTVEMRFDMRMRELDEPVVVEAPADARPLPGGF